MLSGAPFVVSWGERARAARYPHYGLTSDEELPAFKAAPSWAARVGAAHTIIREFRAEAEEELDGQFAARITVPCGLSTGTSGPQE